MPRLTNRQKLTDDDKKALAQRYWKIKGLGSIKELFKEYGVSKPTGLKIAHEYQLTKPSGKNEMAGRPDTTPAATQPERGDTKSRACPTSVPVP